MKIHVLMKTGLIGLLLSVLAGCQSAPHGLTAEQIQGLTVLHSLNNFIPVTIGNILGGMVFVGIPCYFIYKKKWQKWHEESKNA